MKKLILILIVFFQSCQPAITYKQERGLSPDQIKIKNLIDRYEELYNAAPNELKKGEIRKSYLGTINKFLIDSLRLHINNCKVRLTDLSVRPIQDIIAFYAVFKDSLDNKYWMEFDYDKNKKDKLDSNYSYKLLQNMPQNRDTVLSFYYMGETEWDGFSDYDKTLKIRVVPFAKDFNFDSVKAANATRKIKK